MGYINTMRTKFRWLLIVIIIFALVVYLFKKVDKKKNKVKKSEKMTISKQNREFNLLNKTFFNFPRS